MLNTYTLPEQISIPQADFARWWINNGFRTLPEKETEHRAFLTGEIDYLWDNKKRAAAGYAPRQTAPYSKKGVPIHHCDLANPRELVFSMDAAGTTKKDDALQVFWVEGMEGKRLCVRVHAVDATACYPVGSLQDDLFQTVVNPTYFLTEGLYPITIPAVAKFKFREMKDATEALTKALYFNENEARPSISCELFYDVANSSSSVASAPSSAASTKAEPTDAKLTASAVVNVVCDETACRFYRSKVTIKALMEFNEGDQSDASSAARGCTLEEAMKALEGLPIHAATYAAMTERLERSGLLSKLPSIANPNTPASPSSLSLEGVFAAYLTMAVAESLSSLAGGALLEQILSSAKKTSAVGASIDKVFVTYKPSKSDKTRWILSAEGGHGSLRILSEYSRMATQRLLGHKGISDFVPGYTVHEDDVANVHDTICWAVQQRADPSEKAKAIDRKALGEMPLADALRAYAALMGLKPYSSERSLHLRGSVESLASFIPTSCTHPGRDYSHLLFQRLLAFSIDFPAAQAEEGKGSASAPSAALKTQQRQLTTAVAKAMLGVDTFEKAEDIVQAIEETSTAAARLDEAATAARMLGLLSNQKKNLINTKGAAASAASASASAAAAGKNNNAVAGELPVCAVVEKHAKDTLICRFPTLDVMGSKGVGALRVSIRLPSQPEGEGDGEAAFQLPPKGATIGALLRRDNEAAGAPYVARLAYTKVALCLCD